MLNEKKIIDIYQHLGELSKTVTLYHFKELCKSSDASIEETVWTQHVIDKNLKQFDLELETKAMNLKLGFSLSYRQLISLTPERVKKLNEDTEFIAVDFFSEFSNLSMGTIKKELEKDGFDSKALILRPFVPMDKKTYIVKTIQKNTVLGEYCDFWYLKTNEGNLFFYLQVEMKDWDYLADLRLSDIQIDEGFGDVEFI